MAPTINTKKLNLELLKDECIKELYRNRLIIKMRHRRIKQEDNVEKNLSKVKNIIEEAAKMALRDRNSIDTNAAMAASADKKLAFLFRVQKYPQILFSGMGSCTPLYTSHSSW